MSVKSAFNQFLGINPHLHSFWQAQNLWSRFHGFHIAQLMASLKQQLVLMGYTAETEESLQIRRYGDKPLRPQADVIIRDTNPIRFSNSPQMGMAIAPEAIALKELEGEVNLDNPYLAVGIYEFSNYEHGELVAWLELLSPTNKGNTRDAIAYQAKRRLLLQQGIVFVEMDYLHETPPTFARIADYTQRENYASPYRIIALEPRPNYRDTTADLHSFYVDDPLPTLTLRLNGDDTVTIDFNTIYQKTFQEGVYGFDMTYDELPLRFHTYSPSDQAHIVTRMVHILERHQKGHGLDVPPQPLATMDLASGLQQLAQWGVKI
jgi:hypothetical protein